ncbi:hypothetical protein HAX54_048882 [Datura stramonium]|uniref:Uncharacterized protein n=1 Tax=Datura stramonium TaxID=4076 RepID=A0ABS8WM03_DATST|nr:hypothetical protein [Datura stramonium]
MELWELSKGQLEHSSSSQEQLIDELARPLRSVAKSKTLKSFIGTACVGIVGFSSNCFYVLKGALEGFDEVTVSDFWNWLEFLWAWNSARMKKFLSGYLLIQ